MSAFPKDIEVEKAFNAFIKDFGGELLDEIFAGYGQRPNNADYLLRNRTIIAELKCLEKDYSTDKNVGEKLVKLLNQWDKKGLLSKKRISENKFQLEEFSLEQRKDILKIFTKSIKEAVEKANLQIKKTREYFELPNAKGLLILANDGNYSLPPLISMHVLSRLLRSRYSGIDSFIYFTPNLRVIAPQINREANVWISGASREPATSIESVYLDEIANGWLSFVAHKVKEPITVFETSNDDIIEHMRFVK